MAQKWRRKKRKMLRRKKEEASARLEAGVTAKTRLEEDVDPTRKVIIVVKQTHPPTEGVTADQIVRTIRIKGPGVAKDPEEVGHSTRRRTIRVGVAPSSAREEDPLKGRFKFSLKRLLGKLS